MPRPSPVLLPAPARTGARTGARLGLVAAMVASLAALAAGGLTSGGSLGSETHVSAGGPSGDLSGMRAIRRQQLAVSTAADTPRVRVIEVD